MTRRVAVAAGIATLALVTPAQAGPPQGGLVVPGRSFGGIRLGATPAQVRARWGADHGVCSSCPQPTWYYNYAKFQPQGVGVTFRRGRAVALFTVWSPPAWHTSTGLRIGDEAFTVTDYYGILARTRCAGYSVLELRAANGDRTAFYLHDGRIWGLGLTARGAPACREARRA